MSFFARPNTNDDDQSVIKQRQAALSQQWRSPINDEVFQVSQQLSVANQRNCENMVGSIQLPLGVAGPVQVSTAVAADIQTAEYMLPLATSEGALVASVSRGVKAINQAGGVQVQVETAGMSRAPVFAFADGRQAAAFATYLEQAATQAAIKQITESTSQHLQFRELRSFVRGRSVFVRFSFLTNEAMGMNMVTIALDQLWQQLLSQYPQIELVALSSNVCTDKKAAAINLLLGRGWSAQAEVKLSAQILTEILHTDAARLLRTHQLKNLQGSNLAGSFSQQMQFANVVAAFYAATGQDLAHIAEASQGTTMVEAAGDGIYMAVHLPNLPLGSVGGGTGLPSQAAARSLIDRQQDQPGVRTLAAVLAAGVLAAEISGLAALSDNTLAQAHQALARKSA
jgi:hydroxymethylglutaryl-CoA reductase (NADPH)